MEGENLKNEVEKWKLEIENLKMKIGKWKLWMNNDEHNIWEIIWMMNEKFRELFAF